MKATVKILMTFFATAVTVHCGFSQFKISGEIRPRFEYRHGYLSLADSAMKPAAFVDQRTRLNVEYTTARTVFRVVLQDVRVWGSQSQLVGNEAYGSSVHEAFGIVKPDDNWQLKFGRQELVYDDHRIFGNVDWTQQARSHDALLFQYQKNKIRLDIGGAWNQDTVKNKSTSYSVPKSYKTMQYAWANYQFSDQFNLSLLALSLGQQVNFIDQSGNSAYQDNYTLTCGSRLVFKKGKFGASSNLFYQAGSTNTWPAKAVNAYLLNIDFSYQVKDPFRLTAGFEMISGNSQVDTTASYKTVQHAFNPYFGTNHKFNGYMDYFYVGNHIGSVGLNDAYAGLEYKKEKFSLGLTGHAFLAQADVLDMDVLISDGRYEAMNPYLGAEIDLYGSRQLAPGVECTFGYSHLFGTETMEAVKGGDRNATSNWAYISIRIKPVLFEQKP